MIAQIITSPNVAGIIAAACVVVGFVVVCIVWAGHLDIADREKGSDDRDRLF